MAEKCLVLRLPGAQRIRFLPPFFPVSEGELSFWKVWMKVLRVRAGECGCAPGLWSPLRGCPSPHAGTFGLNSPGQATGPGESGSFCRRRLLVWSLKAHQAFPQRDHGDSREPSSRQEAGGNSRARSTARPADLSPQAGAPQPGSALSSVPQPPGARGCMCLDLSNSSLPQTCFCFGRNALAQAVSRAPLWPRRTQPRFSEWHSGSRPTPSSRASPVLIRGDISRSPTGTQRAQAAGSQRHREAWWTG